MTQRDVTLLTYTTDSFRPQQDDLCRSALQVGFGAALALTPEDIAGTPFAIDNAPTLSARRGAGYWLWKPYIIRQQLETMHPDAVLVYCDCGRDISYAFTRFPAALVAAVRENSLGCMTGVVVDAHGPLATWTKRDCLVLLGADEPDYLTKPPIQATWSLWRNTAFARDFLDRWLEAAADPRCLTDEPNVLGLPNHPGFLGHRHDQSISTLLSYRLGAPFFDLTDHPAVRLMHRRPQSLYAHAFLKRPQNVDTLLRSRAALPHLAGFYLREKLAKFRKGDAR